MTCCQGYACIPSEEMICKYYALGSHCGLWACWECNSLFPLCIPCSRMVRWNVWVVNSSNISCFTCTQKDWMSLLLLAVASTLPHSRSVCMCSMVFIPVASQLLCQLSRGFPLMIPLRGCNVYTCFFKSILKQGLIIKPVQIGISNQHRLCGCGLRLVVWWTCSFSASI